MAVMGRALRKRPTAAFAALSLAAFIVFVPGSSRANHAGVTCRGFPVTSHDSAGTDGPDTLEGTPDMDIMQGKGGKDTIRGKAGPDLICGGDGADDIDGNRANEASMVVKVMT